MFLVWRQLVEERQRVGGLPDDDLQLAQRLPPHVLVLLHQLLNALSGERDERRVTSFHKSYFASSTPDVVVIPSVSDPYELMSIISF